MPADRELSTAQVSERDLLAFINRELIPFVRKLSIKIAGAVTQSDLTAIQDDIAALQLAVSLIDASLTILTASVATKTTVQESNSLPNSSDSTNTSANIAITKALHYKHVLVVSTSGGAVTMKLPSDASEPDIAIGDWGVVRFESGTIKPNFASDGTSVIVGSYLSIGRVESEVRWRKIAANTYQLGGNSSL